MQKPYEAELEKSIAVAIEAGKIVMEVYKTDFKVDFKADDSPVTQADRKADELIRRRLLEAFPHHGMLSEENIDKQNPLDKRSCFIVDPVDGTKEFVRRSDQFGVNIALSDNGQSVMGVIYIPATRKIFYAVRGRGSFRADVDDAGRLSGVLKNQVSNRKKDLIMTMSQPFPGKKTAALIEKYKEYIASILYVGSSIKGCMIASGEADIYYRFGHTSEWDTAAMQAIVEEAGGIVRQMDGSLLTYNRHNHLNAKGFYVVNRKENIWLGGWDD